MSATGRAPGRRLASQWREGVGMSTVRIACYLAALSLVFYGISTFAVLHFLETTKCLP